MAGLLTTTVVAIVGPILVYVWPPSREKKAGLTVSLPQDVDSIGEGNVVQFTAPANTAFVMATGGGGNAVGDPTFGGFLVNAHGKLDVLAQRCPHLGCSVGFDQTAGIFKCPCHGSQFSQAGKVIHGPATADMATLSWKKGDKPDEIIVNGLKLET